MIPISLKGNQDKLVTSFYTIFNEYYHLILIGYDYGTVELNLVLETPLPQWDLPSFQQTHSISLLTLECLDLLNPIIQFVQDPQYNDIVYAFHDSCVYRICLSEWIQTLQSTPSMDLLQSCSCDISCLVNISSLESECDPISSFHVITDIYLGYSWQLFTLKGRYHTDTLPIRVKESVDSIDKLKNKHIESYSSTLSDSWTIPKCEFINVTSSMLKLPKEMYPECITESSLLEFTKTVASLRQSIQNYVEFGKLIQSRFF